jgi:hypothetical protein
MIAHADRGADKDVAVPLPATLRDLLAEDIMGNAKPLAGNTLILSKTGRPIILYGGSATGASFLDAMAPLDRKHAGFVTTSHGTPTYRLPQVWEGTRKGSAEGNPVAVDGKPIWRVDRLLPADPIMPDHYTAMVWGNQVWTAPDKTQGGHPSAKIADGNINFGTMGAWAGDMNFQKLAALAFIAPEPGAYRVTGTARSKPWEGGAKIFRLGIFKKDAQRAVELEILELPRDGSPVPFAIEADLSTGHELVFATQMPDMHNATNTRIETLEIRRLP